MPETMFYLCHRDGYGEWDITAISADVYSFIRSWWQNEASFAIDCISWDILPDVQALVSGHDSLMREDWEAELLSLLSENYLMDAGL